MRYLLVAILVFFTTGAVENDGGPIVIDDGLTSDKLSVTVEDLIPDYAAELERLQLPWNGRIKVEHRELMWATVEESFQDLEVDDRIKLMKLVRDYPLYTKLPDRVAWNNITNVWSLAAKRFVKKIRALPR